MNRVVGARMLSRSPTSFRVPLLASVASFLVALCACGPAPLCTSLTGKNLVAGSALASTMGENCVARVSGTIDGHGGETSISVACAPPTVRDPVTSPSRRFNVTLPDPRTWDSTSPVKATEMIEESKGGSSVSVSGPVTAKLEVVESRGTKVLLPAATTDDFVRRGTVRITDAGGADVTLDVTIRATDLRQAERDCSGE